MSVDVQDLLRGFQQPWRPGFEARLGALPAELATLIRDRVNGLSTADQAFTDALHASDAASRQVIAAVHRPLRKGSGCCPAVPVASSNDGSAQISEEPRFSLGSPWDSAQRG